MQLFLARYSGCKQIRHCDGVKFMKGSVVNQNIQMIAPCFSRVQGGSNLANAVRCFRHRLADAPDALFMALGLSVFLRVVGMVVLLMLGASGLVRAASADQSQPLASAPSRSALAHSTPLVIGSEQDYPPFATGMTDDTAGGFTVDLWKMVAQAAGFNYRLRVLPFHELLREFKEGKIDVLINLAMTDERRQFADFSIPHVTVHGGIFVRNDQTNIQSEADLAGKSILVVNADAAHDYAIAKGWGKQLVAVDTAAEGLRMLASGRHDAMLLSQLTGLQILHNLALAGIKALPVKAGFAQKFAFATQHGQTDLLASINEELAVIKADHRYDALYETWFAGLQVREIGLLDLLKYLIPVVVLLLSWVGYFAYRRLVERNLAAAAIAESHDLLRAIIDTVPVRVFWKNRELNYLGCNAAFARDAGMVHPGDVIGKDDYQMGWAAQAELYRADDRQVLESGQARLSYDEPQTTPDGRTIWLRTSKVALKNARQETVGMLGIYEDITDRVKSEHEKAEALSHLQKVARSVPGMVYQYRLHPDGRSCIPFASEAIRDIFRISAEDARADASNVLTTIHPDDYAGVVASIRLSAQNVTEWQHEFRVRFDDGTVRWLLGNAMPEREADGSVLWHGFVTDITDRIRSTEKIQVLMLEQNTILNNSLVGIVTVRDRTIVWANSTFEKMLGYAADEMQGLCTRVTFPSQDAFQAFGDIAYQVIHSGQVFRGWYELVRKDGAHIWVDVSGETLHQDKGDSLWIFSDITQRKLAESRLIQSEAKIKGVLESAADAIFITDQSGNLQYTNESASHMLGYSRVEFAQMTINDLAMSNDQVAVRQLFSQLVSTGTLRLEMRMRRKDGSVVPVDMNGAVLPDGSVLGACRDITERKKTEKLLQESESHLHAIIETEPECIKVVDAQGLLVQMNPAGLAMIEADSLAQVAGTPVVQVVAPEYRQAFEAMHQRVMAGESVKMEFVVIGLKGGRRWVETSAAPMQEHGQTVHLAVTRDITQRKQMEDQVRKLAFHDPLTGLPNRRLLMDRLNQAMVASKRSACYCALMFLDLDKFKVLNDTHGHEAGDLLLLEVTRRLTSCVREVDTVSRFGGDEFVVLLGDLVTQREVSTTQTAIVAEKIRLALQGAYVLKIRHEGCADRVIEYHCSASIGVAMFINHEASQDDIIKWADAAMYQAKEAGGNTIRFHEAL